MNEYPNFNKRKQEYQQKIHEIQEERYQRRAKIITGCFYIIIIFVVIIACLGLYASMID